MKEASFAEEQQTSYKEFGFQPNNDQAARMRKSNLLSEKLDDNEQSPPKKNSKHVSTNSDSNILLIAKMTILFFAIASCVLLGLALTIETKQITVYTFISQIILTLYFTLEIVMKWYHADNTYKVAVSIICAFSQGAFLIWAAYLCKSAIFVIIK